MANALIATLCLLPTSPLSPGFSPTCPGVIKCPSSRGYPGPLSRVLSCAIGLPCCIRCAFEGTTAPIELSPCGLLGPLLSRHAPLCVMVLCAAPSNPSQALLLRASSTTLLFSTDGLVPLRGGGCPCAQKDTFIGAFPSAAAYPSRACARDKVNVKGFSGIRKWNPERP